MVPLLRSAAYSTRTTVAPGAPEQLPPLRLPCRTTGCRYTPLGTLDATFGTGGVVTYDGGLGTDDGGLTLAIDGSGKIVVAGGVNNGTDFDMAVWRFNPDGTLDTGFGTGGIMTHAGAAGGTGDDAAFGVTIDSSGKILATGNSMNAAANADMVIWRINP